MLFPAGVGFRKLAPFRSLPFFWWTSDHNLRQHGGFAHNEPQHVMAAPQRPTGRLSKPRDDLQRAIQAAERGLASASAEGFREVLKHARDAVLGSQRLVLVLDHLVRQGLRRQQSPELLSASEVQVPIQALRVAVGVLAATTPLKFSADYKQYTERVQALIDIARSVLDRGLEPVAPLSELDEWKLFREP